SRDLFIQHALVEGDWQTRHHFFRDNTALRAELEEMEERARRRDLVIDDQELFALYDARIPPEAVSARHFDAWWKKQRHKTPDLLTFTRAELLRSDAADEHPDTWRTEDLALPLTYRFEPGAADDGVTVHIPVEVLTRIGGDGFAWQVPALREELVTALIKSLPKELRRNFVPAPDTARAILDDLNPGTGSLLPSRWRPPTAPRWRGARTLPGCRTGWRHRCSARWPRPSPDSGSAPA
ncbi:MAG: ATP-dependent helicase, partial [Mycobacterium sp.]|nr:ATP-dependent helicase [Mycobacterium sp.]